jgi:PAS domain S-box-containing protein
METADMQAGHRTLQSHFEKASRYLAAFPALIFVIAAAILSHADYDWTYEAPLLLLFFNTVFLFVSPLTASYFAAGSTLASGSSTTLFFGCSLLTIACSGLCAGLVRGGPDGANDTATVHNLGFLLASLFNLAGMCASVSPDLRLKYLGERRRGVLIACYSGVVAIICLLTFLTISDLTPHFFIQGQGPTLLRQSVLALAVTFFAVPALFFMQHRSGTPFLYWYSLSLLLIAQGLSIVLFQKSLGSPTNWLGRAFQYIGGIYFLVALIGGSKEARTRGTSFVEMLPGIVDIARLRQTEEALSHSEERLRTLAEATFEGIAVTEDGRIQDINDQFCRICGYDRSELIGMELSALLLPEERRHVMENIISGRDTITEHSLVRKNGTIVTIEARGKTVGQRNLRHTAFRDITERKRAERMLNEALEFTRAILDTVDGLIVVLDPQGRIVRFNTACERLTGWRLDEVDGRCFWEFLVPEEQRAGVIETFKKLTSGMFPNRYENDWILRDGTRRWIAWANSVMLDSKGEIEFVIGTGVDVSKSKLAREALRKSELRFRLLSETAGQLLAAKTPQAIVNELCQKIMEHLDCHAFFNFLAHEQTGRLHLNTCAGIPEEDARKIEWLDYGVAVCGCAAQTRERIVAENIFNTPDIRTDLVKSYGIQAYACHPLIVQGRLIGTLSFGTKTRQYFSPDDLAFMKTVTNQVAIAMDRMKLIEELQRSRDELEIRVEERTVELETYMARLERSNQDLRDFASIASHDMKEPLRKVISFGNMLSNKYADSLGQTGADYLNRMLDATQRMQTLLTSLLEYSRVTTHSEPFREVDLLVIVHEVLSDLEVRILSTRGEVRVSELPVLSADPTQMRQLFQNLIGNALKFHKKGETPIVKVICTSHHEHCEIIVEDNGIGLEPRQFDRIFAPFQRLHGRGEYEGTGMGLAICKKIVERHNGTVTVKSTPGEGATFTVSLPVKQKVD